MCQTLSHSIISSRKVYILLYAHLLLTIIPAKKCVREGILFIYLMYDWLTGSVVYLQQNKDHDYDSSSTEPFKVLSIMKLYSHHSNR